MVCHVPGTVFRAMCVLSLGTHSHNVVEAGRKVHVGA